MNMFRILFRYGKNGEWSVVYSSIDSVACFDMFSRLREDNNVDPNKRFICQVFFGGKYRSIIL